MVFYWSSTVTVSPSRTVSEIQPLTGRKSLFFMDYFSDDDQVRIAERRLLLSKLEWYAFTRRKELWRYI